MRYKIELVEKETGRISSLRLKGKEKRFFTKHGAKRELECLNTSFMKKIYNASVVRC